MRRLFYFLIGIALVGCASARPRLSIHDYCVKHLSHFKDYDECYTETKERREEKRERQDEAIDDFGNSMKALNRPRSAPKTTRCRTDGAGAGAETVCETQ